MIFLHQLIYLLPGGEDDYNTFESIVLPLLGQYGGNLLLRLRPTNDSVIEQSIETPYEVHLISFESEAGIKAYLQDETRQKYLFLKEKSIASSIVYQGTKM